MSVAPVSETVGTLLKGPGGADALRLYTPTTPEEVAVDAHINAHPFVASLRADPSLRESRPHMHIPEAFRAQNLTGGTLMGPGKVVVPPFAWEDGEGGVYTQVFYVGAGLCGHPGIVHGGFLATMLDEGLARCCFAAVPSKVAVTASLNINYKNPAPADSYLVLRAETTKVEGRKAWVRGRIETLPVAEGEEPRVLTEADGLFISPRNAAVGFSWRHVHHLALR